MLLISKKLQLSGLLKTRNFLKKLFFKLLICSKYEITLLTNIGNILMVIYFLMYLSFSHAAYEGTVRTCFGDVQSYCLFIYLIILSFQCVKCKSLLQKMNSAVFFSREQMFGLKKNKQFIIYGLQVQNLDIVNPHTAK